MDDRVSFGGQRTRSRFPLHIKVESGRPLVNLDGPLVKCCIDSTSAPSTVLGACAVRVGVPEIEGVKRGEVWQSGSEA